MESVEAVLQAFQAKETLELLAEALNGEDEERRRLARNLQATSRAVIANSEGQERLKALLVKLGGLQAELNREAKALFDEMNAGRRTRSKGRVDARLEAGR